MAALSSKSKKLQLHTSNKSIKEEKNLNPSVTNLRK
jgi:hypothetical protein